MQGRKTFFRRFSSWVLFSALIVGALGGAGLSAIAAPKPANALDIIISEVAWAGTDYSPNDQWIELYNPGSSAIDITGWQIADSTDGSGNINKTLTGTILPGKYFLLENTNDEPVNDVTADDIFSGDLNIAGESLFLYDKLNNLIDSANGNGGIWPAGDTVSYYSMERKRIITDSDYSWASNNGITRNGVDFNNTPINGTPKQHNSAMYTEQTIIISEIQWMGTEASEFDEWIELYNPSLIHDIDLTGWKVEAEDGDPSIPLAGTISKGSYYLLERSDGFVTSEGENRIYTGSLMSDTGEALFLLAPDRNVIDTANAAGGAWPAGEIWTDASGDTHFSSMERLKNNGTIVPDGPNAWVTNIGKVKNGIDAAGNDIYGTPGQENWGFNLTIPSIRGVVISEVAWAGTKASTDDEWIELHNPGATAIDLAGWKVQSADGTPSIMITGTIPAGGFYLLERGIGSGTDVIENQLYSSGLLSESGEKINLLAPNKSVIDTANSAGTSWPAGGGANFASMERVKTGSTVEPDNPFAWITNIGVVKNGKDASGNDIFGTPGKSNWAFSVAPTATPTPTNTPEPADLLDIVISEVAWSGTRASGDDEWIELYNPTNRDIDLTGWTLYSSDGSPRIDDEFNGIILESEEYLLLERDNDDTITELPEDYTCPSIIYQGTLNNTGEKLYLTDELNNVIDQANTNGGAWPAGSTVNSMQRSLFEKDSDYVWVSYDQSKDTEEKYALDADGDPIRGTPCRANLPFNVTPTVTPSPTRTPVRSSGSSGNTNVEPILVISEFLPRPGTDWNNDGQVDVFDEFIEVINGGSINVNLGGYRLDDEEDEGSSPYSLPNRTLRPGERAVFYAAQTGILLSDAGDTVRLLRGSKVEDAYTYDFARYPDQSWCRLLESYGDWSTPCFPTPNNPNALTGTLPRPSGPSTNLTSKVCLMPDTAPDVFVYAECEAPGGGIFNRQYWDGLGIFKWLIPYIDQRLNDFFE